VPGRTGGHGGEYHLPGTRGHATIARQGEGPTSQQETTMRTNAIGITLALALTVGAASVAEAQQGSRPERPRVAQDSTFPRGPGCGMDAMLLRGITLSADQQQRLAALRATERQKMGAGPATARPPRVAGQRRDTTGMGERRARMEKMQEQHVAALKSILTTDQQAQL